MDDPYKERLGDLSIQNLLLLKIEIKYFVCN